MIDVLVVGAGPAGMAAAIHATDRGARTLLVDARNGPMDKPCGEGLMPGALRDLEKLGLHHIDGHPFRGIRYVRGATKALGLLPSPGRGVRRTALQHALRARAETLGVAREQRRVHAVELHGDHVNVDGIRARWLIAADGLRSRIRGQLDLLQPTDQPRRYGMVQHFQTRPWSDTVDVHWADDAEAYVTPVSAHQVGVALLFGDAARAQGTGTPYDRVLDRFPSLRERLGPSLAPPKGAGPFFTRTRARVKGRALLVGDAAGFVDPITGEGVKLGVRSAMAAVDAVLDGVPDRYEHAWREMFTPYERATRGPAMAHHKPTAPTRPARHPQGESLGVSPGAARAQRVMPTR